jgi:glycosyltransferase involved in cell wall biosynthesis
MDRGGAEVRTLEVMRRLDPARYRFDFCVTSGLAGALDQEIRSLGGEVYPVATGPGFALRFAALLGRGRYDAVHSHVHYFGALPLAVAALAGVPVRIAHFRTTHDGKPSTPRRRIQRALLRGLLGQAATSVLAVSRAALDSAWGPEWPRDPRCRVVYNGIDVERFSAAATPGEIRSRLGIGSAAPLVLHVARFDPAKNHAKLLHVFADVVRRRPEARLVLAGPKPGPDSEPLEAMIRAAGLDDSVTLAGCRDDIPDLLAAAGVMIFPSLREGLPGAVLEAAAAGLPVLASDIAPHREIAERVASVHTLPLSLPHGLWAARALDLADRGRRPGQALAGTPFQLADTVRAFEAAYAGALA